ncbi:MAG: glycosyltransferase family 2 protein [Thermoanaerobaculia bacterium]
MISLLLVNYRSASLAAGAVASARMAATQPLQVVIVDNSCDPREADALRPHADVLIVSDRNRGYAGAINDGRPACTASTIVIANPDVTFMTGAIDALVAPIEGSVAVAGPALFWDDACQWFLPPADVHTGLDVFAAALASRSSSFHDIRDRRRIRRRFAFWMLEGVTLVPSISGAVMALTAGLFDALGGFDERFFLYFEETDFLRRASEKRRDIVYVPGAKCRHLYNQSAGQSSDTPALYAQSERRYFEKWNGPFVASVLERMRRAPRARPAQDLSGPLVLIERNVVIEVSPLPSFETAAGHFPRQNVVDIPPEVARSFQGDELYLRVVKRDTAEVLATYRRRTGD